MLNRKEIALHSPRYQRKLEAQMQAAPCQSVVPPWPRARTGNNRANKTFRCSAG